MTEAQKTLLDQLAASLFNCKTESVVTEEVIAEARQQAVTTLIPVNYCKDYRSLLIHNMRMTMCHQHLHTVMTKHGIPYAVLKGVASASFYPDPVRRSMGDVDFIVKPSDFDRACEALKSEGYRCWEEKHEVHVCFDTDHGHWEMHWKPPGVPRDSIVKEYLNDLVDCAVEYNGCMIPSVFHHGLVLLLHNASHWITTGIGLRHLCDWAVFVNTVSEEEFISLFEEPLKRIGLWRFACLMTAVCIRYLNLPECRWPGEVDKALLEDMIDDIFAGGNFGYKDMGRLNQAKLMTDTGRRTVDDTGMFRQLIQALAGKARTVWPVCDKVRLLLPVGVVFVAVRHLVLAAQGKRRAINVSNMISGAKTRRVLYRKFELFQPTKKR